MNPKIVMIDNIVTFICDGTVDSQGDIINIKDVEIPKGGELVSVSLDFGKKIGTATLYKDGYSVRANIKINHETIPDYVLKSLKPAVQGRVRRDLDGKAQSYLINGISLVKENSDKRILPIGENIRQHMEI